MDGWTYKSEEICRMSGLNPSGNRRKSKETGGKSRKKREIPDKFRKKAERTGKSGKIFGSGPKGRGFESRHFDSGEYWVSMLSGFLFMQKVTCFRRFTTFSVVNRYFCGQKRRGQKAAAVYCRNLPKSTIPEETLCSRSLSLMKTVKDTDQRIIQENFLKVQSGCTFKRYSQISQQARSETEELFFWKIFKLATTLPV